ncbi:hypothetical protein BGX27_005972, partial [Mortierella sp. AM989]
SDYTSAENQKLFISSGSADRFKPLTQFFSLDLSVPWDSDAPAWKSLAQRPRPLEGTLALSKDNTKLFAFDAFSVHQYNIQTDTWKPDSPQNRTLDLDFSFVRGAVTDAHTGLIYGLGAIVKYAPWLMTEFDPDNNSYKKINITGGRSNGSGIVSLAFSNPARKIYMYEWGSQDNESALLSYDLVYQNLTVE